MTLRTNYYALIDFEDGDLTTSAADYLPWQISLDDANDSDGDGIPDFTDDPADQNVDRPELSVSVANNLHSLIRGEVGKSYDVEGDRRLAGRPVDQRFGCDALTALVSHHASYRRGQINGILAAQRS
jgi:hypothetical protein